MIEVWKYAVGYEEKIQVSNLGRVRNSKTGRIYKTFKSKYEQFAPYVDGKKTCALVHRLVCEAFVPNPENKSQVNHKDGNKYNNKAANLEWVTGKENIRHAFDTGLSVSNQKFGERNSNSKLDWNSVRKIRELKLKNSTLSPSMIKEMLHLNVGAGTINAVLKNITWKE